jgi:hypothetical protein
MIFSSKDAEIIGGVDHPVQPTIRFEAQLVHAAGVHYALDSDGAKSWGPSYEYDWKRLRLGVDLGVIQRPLVRTEFAIAGRILWRFRGGS